jgi:hypothetical protein
MHLWQLTMIFSADTVSTTLSSPLSENAASGTALPGEGLELRFQRLGLQPRQTFILRPPAASFCAKTMLKKRKLHAKQKALLRLDSGTEAGTKLRPLPYI